MPPELTRAHQTLDQAAELLDLLTDAGVDSPPHEDMLDELNPFAVEARYGLTDPGRIDRDATTRRVGALLVWAEGQLSKPATTAG